VRNNVGYTLLEILVVLALSTVLSLAFFSVIGRFQRWEQEMHQILQRDENLRLAPLLLSRYLNSAGNNQWERNWDGVELGLTGFKVQSDIDGRDGFPDLLLESPFENMAIRHRGQEIQLRSGGGSFQPLLRNIRSLDDVTLTDSLLTLTITGEAGSETAGRSTEKVPLTFFLWNYRSNLFPERR